MYCVHRVIMLLIIISSTSLFVHFFTTSIIKLLFHSVCNSALIFQNKALYLHIVYYYYCCTRQIHFTNESGSFMFISFEWSQYLNDHNIWIVTIFGMDIFNTCLLKRFFEIFKDVILASSCTHLTLWERSFVVASSISYDPR